MALTRSNVPHAVPSSGLADVLERVLDKGVVICGDIKIKLVDIELLTIQIRLMIASVDKAKELGMDWWMHNPAFSSRAMAAPVATPLPAAEDTGGSLDALRQQVQALQSRIEAISPR